MLKLFLDDVRQPYDDSWTFVRNYDEFCSYIDDYKRIQCEEPLVVSFDHDLSNEHYRNANFLPPDYSTYIEKTGYDCAKYMVDAGVVPGLVIVHSWNIYGQEHHQSANALLLRFKRPV